MREAVWFICEQDTGGLFLPNNRVTDKTGVVDKTVAEFLVGKHPPERKPHCSTLEACEETTIFILVDITEDVVELAVWKI